MPSILHNFVHAEGNIGKKFRKLLRDTSSRAAIDAAGEPVAYENKEPVVTKSAGQRHKFMRRIVNYKREGPFHRQVGVRWLHGEAWPIMQTYFRHRFLHATKGWREYTGGPSMRLPLNGMPHLPYPQRFYGRHQFASTY